LSGGLEATIRLRASLPPGMLNVGVCTRFCSRASRATRGSTKPRSSSSEIW
jgi:hypothetical protein